MFLVSECPVCGKADPPDDHKCSKTAVMKYERWLRKLGQIGRERREPTFSERLAESRRLSRDPAYEDDTDDDNR